MMRFEKLFLRVWIGVVFIFLMTLLWQNHRGIRVIAEFQGDRTLLMILDWQRFALEADRYTEGMRAPVAARIFGYIGIGAWETYRLAMQEPALPEPWAGLELPETDNTWEYNMPLALNAYYAAIFQHFYLSAPFHIRAQRKARADQWDLVLSKDLSAQAASHSRELGQLIADLVFNWSQGDSLGRDGHLHNFDPEYALPEGDQFWRPCTNFPTPALLPHWGRVRTFLLDTTHYLATPLPPFSVESHSDYFLHALEIYSIQLPLSDENRWIGEFWSDDHPGLTFTSAARCISIANQVVAKANPPTRKALQTYLFLGVAVHDALVTCWHSKYTYQLLRPETLIRSLFRADWQTSIHTPPFPSYPSGHAMVSAAAAEVLTFFYGDNFPFTDESHKGRPEFMSTPRSYPSFRAMAAENAYSRVALGVHFRFDCDEGARLGARAGREVCSRLSNE